MKRSIFSKGLALFLALLMACSVIPVTAFAANSGKYIKDVFANTLKMFLSPTEKTRQLPTNG